LLLPVDPESSESLPDEPVRSLKGSWIEAGGMKGLELALSWDSSETFGIGEESRKGSKVNDRLSVMAGGAMVSCERVGW
jgi:hypothetical protein